MRKILITHLLLISFLTGCIEAESKDYWEESDLCDSREECIELGDKYGEDIFDTLALSFSYSDLWSFMYVGLEGDNSGIGGEFPFDRYTLAKYEKLDNGFERTLGVSNPFYESVQELVQHLMFDRLIEVETILFLSVGSPSMTIQQEGNQLAIPPKFLEDFPSQNVVFILLHELAHALTLNDILDTEACNEEVNVETCFDSDTYIYQFAEEFWTDYPENWKVLYYHTMDYKERSDFYRSNTDQFISVYAAVNPTEDIAEAFAQFVLTPYNEEPNNIAEEKLSFFYQYDELVEYRTYILKYLQKNYAEKESFL